MKMYSVIAGQGNGKEVSEEEPRPLMGLNENGTTADQGLPSQPELLSVSTTLPSSSANWSECEISEFQLLSKKLEIVKAQLAEEQQRIVELDAEINMQNILLEEGEEFDLRYGEEVITGYQDIDNATDVQELENIWAQERKLKKEAEEEVAKLKRKIQSEEEASFENFKNYLTEQQNERNILLEKKFDELSQHMNAQFEKMHQYQTALRTDVGEINQNLKRLNQVTGPPTSKNVTATKAASIGKKKKRAKYGKHAKKLGKSACSGFPA